MPKGKGLHAEFHGKKPLHIWCWGREKIQLCYTIVFVCIILSLRSDKDSEAGYMPDARAKKISKKKIGEKAATTQHKTGFSHSFQSEP